MEAIYYQLLIFGTILVTFLFKKKVLIFVCIFWALWTFIKLSNPLLAVQLTVVWGSYAMLKIYEAQTKKNSELEQAMSKLSDRQRESAEGIPEECRQLLTGVEHYDYLLKGISNTKARLIILSGWLSSYVIDDGFLNALSAKLEQSVSVYIGYGWQDSQGQHAQTDSSKKALESLKGLAKKYPSQLFIAKYATHEKLLIIDDYKVVYGSANWLSNRNYKNSERSVVLSDRNLAESEAKRVEALVRKNAEGC